MIEAGIKKSIFSTWDAYLSSGRIVRNTKGEEIDHIDDKRTTAINHIQTIINEFQTGRSNLAEFKTSLDGYNKRNNLWGFTAAKGQMFFNQLTNSSIGTLNELTLLLKESISPPKDIPDALRTINRFEAYVNKIYLSADDKRLVPKPSSINYFLSYFWQIHDSAKWPIFYSSLVNAFEGLGIWKGEGTWAEQYEAFCNLNEEIKKLIEVQHGRPVSNWEVEHAFWTQTENPRKVSKVKLPEEIAQKKESRQSDIMVSSASFKLNDFLIPRLANLVSLGASSDKSSASKGSQFEKLVGEVFKSIGFEVDSLGQGTRRNPDAVIKFREEHTAFLVDAKAYTDGYTLGLDDRAIKEYIGDHEPKLAKEGIRRIGFILVSNSFKSDLTEFGNDLTWQTPIKRFILITSEALLYLVAYKHKDNLPLSDIIKFLVRSESPIQPSDVISQFDDV